MNFYLKTVRALPIRPEERVLVVCGGAFDAQVMRDAGLRDVTISNLAPEGHAARGTEYGDFKFAHEDAEHLSFADGTYDWVIAHAGLHHCASPHAAIQQMLRVARKGILVIEARDSLLMRTAVRLGFAHEFELEAVALSDFRSGGIRDSATPNYIYRWTEREVVKCVESTYPGRINDVRFFYHLTPPAERLTMASPVRRIVAGILALGLRVFQKIFPRQCNEFGFAVLHTAALKPWMGPDGMRNDYALSFDPKKYRPESG